MPMIHRFFLFFLIIAQFFWANKASSNSYEFNEFIDVYIDLRAELDEKHSKDSEYIIEIQSRINSIEDLRNQGVPSLDSMALWEILLFETADRLVDDGGGMNQINFLIENSHILKHIERLNFDSSSGNEKDLFYLRLANIYLRYAVLKSSSIYSDIWLVDENGLYAPNKNSEVFHLYRKTMDAVKQTSFKNYLDNEVYFSNFGHVIDIDGNKISRDEFYTQMELYKIPAVILLSHYARLNDRINYENLLEEISFNIQKNDLYKHLTFDELLAAVVLTDLDSALYLYTANEYIEIIEGLKFKWSTKKEFPYRKVDLNQRLFEYICIPMMMKRRLMFSKKSCPRLIN